MSETRDHSGDATFGSTADTEQDIGPRRARTDRRARPTPMFSRYTFFGRRRGNRRSDDPQNRYYVDWINGRYLLALLLVLGFITIDMASTLHILEQGGSEANPIMRKVLSWGPFWFAFVKVGTALFAFLLLAVHRYFPVARLMVTILLAVYGGIVAFHVFLLMQIHLQ